MKSILRHMIKESFSMEEHRLNEMARVGFVDDFEVIVYTDDPGNIPHVHIVDTATRGEKFSSCIKLEVDEYFPHGGKYRDKFNAKERKAFDKFMRSKPRNNRYATNYEYACEMWNGNNLKTTVDSSREQPDYTKLA